MKNLYLLTIVFLFSSNAFSSIYLGGNYGYSFYSAEALEKYKVSPKGASYGGFVGIGHEFVGLEFIYQNLTSEGKIKHDGGSYTIKENAAAMGGALRLSFSMMYVRLGLARYNVDQSIDIADQTTLAAAEGIYKIQEKGTSKNGSLYGFGFHTKIMSATVFADFTRYQIYSIGHYNAVSVGVSFPIPAKFFELGKN